MALMALGILLFDLVQWADSGNRTLQQPFWKRRPPITATAEEAEKDDTLNILSTYHITLDWCAC